MDDLLAEVEGLIAEDVMANEQAIPDAGAGMISGGVVAQPAEVAVEQEEEPQRRQLVGA